MSALSELLDSTDNPSFTVSQGASLSFRGDFSEIFVVSLKVVAGDYAKAAQWLWNVVAGSLFDAER